MQTTTSAVETTTVSTPAPEPAGTIRADTVVLRRTMAAVRAMMGPNGDTPLRGMPGCRIRTRGQDLQVLAAGGTRALMVYVDAEDAPARLDRALPLAAVRQIAGAKAGEPIGIEAEGPILRIRTAAGEHEYGEPDCIRSKAWDLIVRQDGSQEYAATAREVSRTRALAAVRNLPQTARGLCRLATAPGRLLLWATDCRTIGPQYKPDAELSAAATTCAEGVVTGAACADLIDTLRTMRARTLDIRIESTGRRIWFAGAEGRERFVVGTRALS